MRSLNPSCLSAVAGVTALVGALKGLTGLGSGIVDMASHFETVRTELGTVLQDAEKGAKLFEDLRKFSFDTTFGVDELANASTQLLNAGQNARALQGDLKMLGDLAGGSKNKFAELTSIYSKILTSGRATAIQLNQINLRGIPITQKLREMGIVGVASADQLKQAFKELTDEGGQFHNAMNNIIDTIEGKRGFITDTLKEIQVNIGEVTGLTDAYKKSLDVVYEVLNGFNEELMELNDNPLMSALISGGLVTAIAGIVTLLGGGLVGALVKVASQLGIIAGLKTVLTSPVGWIALGVAGVAGAIAGLVKYKKAQEELEEQAKKTALAIQAELGLMYEPKTTSSQLDQAQGMVEAITQTLNEQKQKLADAQNQLSELRDRPHAKGAYKKLKNELGIDELEESIERGTVALKEWNEQVKFYQDLQEKGKEINGLSTDFERIFGDTDMGKKRQEIEQITKDIRTLKEYLKKDGTLTDNGVFKLTDGVKNDIDQTIAYLERRLKELSGDMGKLFWKDVFTDVTGVTGSNGMQMGGNYMTTMLDRYRTELNRKQALGLADENTPAELARKFIDNIEEQINTLLDMEGVDDPFKLTDKSVLGMIETIEQFKYIIENTGNEIEQSKFLSGEYLEGVFGGLSGDFTNFMNGFKTGGVWGGIINTVIQALSKVAQECDNFDKAMNPVSNAMKQLKKPISDLLNVFGEMEEGIESILSVIASLHEVLSPITTLVFAITKAINLAVKSISYVIKRIVDVISDLKIFKNFKEKLNEFIESVDDASLEIDDYLGIQDELTDKTKDLTQEYNNLLNAMQEQEEWYLQKKTELNAETYKYNYNKVNDMILTPQGNFSTHPDDYIIATKNPSGLGGSTNNVYVKNEVANTTEVSIKEQDNGNGGKDLLVVLSKKIANDVANGANGWDSALAIQQTRMAGRRVRI